ncbi:hypothetical protein BJ166DRAFT_522210 [Pestalotiopsis sp. NC0098]|nr:hypothetical protein BJ166DRAFT_522210 [Pestalotiopsis sp. NC0098]
MSTTILQPHEAHLQSLDYTADTAAAATWPASRTYSTTNPNRNAPSSQHVTTNIWTMFQMHLLRTTLWSLCISLMVMSCIVEQESSPMRIWLALCLLFSWLVPTSLHLHKLIRKFQRRGRVDSFIVTTAMLSFIFIKAFAILGGYSVAALIRVPPCFTLASWVASRWCKFDANPEIRFGA